MELSLVPSIAEREVTQRRADKLSAPSRSIERSEVLWAIWPVLGLFRCIRVSLWGQ